MTTPKYPRTLAVFELESPDLSGILRESEGSHIPKYRDFGGSLGGVISPEYSHFEGILGHFEGILGHFGGISVIKLLSKKGAQSLLSQPTSALFDLLARESS